MRVTPSECSTALFSHYDLHITINIYWLGINTPSGTITTLLLPCLVAMIAPEGHKNTYFATVRVVGLPWP